MSTADQIRQRLITIPISPDCSIEVRRPDLLSQAVNNVLRLPQFQAVITALSAPMLGYEPPPTSAELDAQSVEFIDHWVCAAAVNPRVVLTDEEAEADPSALCVRDLDFEVKLAVYKATCRALSTKGVRDAVSEFRRHVADGALA